MPTLNEIEKEFEEKFKCIQSDCDGNGFCPYPVDDSNWEASECEFHAKYLFPLKAFIRSKLSLVLQDVEDMVMEIKIKIAKAEIYQSNPEQSQDILSKVVEILHSYKV